ncbi:MAG: peptide ABC transporter substrate-binding protein, partial [Thermocrispum sp.]
MRRPRWKAIAALVPAAALIMAGCAPGGEDPRGGGGGGNDAEITVSGTAPENPLVPGNTSEAGGGKIIDNLFTGLINYDAETAEASNAHAEKIDVAKDGKSMTFTLKKGWKFHDGTEIKADNYIKAWNYTAYSPNGQQLGSFFEQVEGFDDVFTVDPDGEEGPKKAPEPKAKEMSGLEKVDDYKFTVTFSEPHPAFQIKVGYSAFMPLPDAFFSDQEAFEKNPIGSGPFKFVERDPNGITIERYEEYQGEDKPNIKRATFVFGTPETHYDKLRDNDIDFLNNMPPKALVDNVWKEDLKGRSGPSGNLSIQLIGFPLYDKKFQDVKFRHAISMAINRKQITEKIYSNTREPVNGYG